MNFFTKTISRYEKKNSEYYKSGRMITLLVQIKTHFICKSFHALIHAKMFKYMRIYNNRPYVAERSHGTIMAVVC